MDTTIIRLQFHFPLKSHLKSSLTPSYFTPNSHHYTKLFNLKHKITCRTSSTRGSSSSGSSNSSGGGEVSGFDEGAYEAERLRLDAKARESMEEIAKRVTVEDESGNDGDDPRAWKWKIRKRVWDLMERLNIAQNPRPVHHRIPNFVGASAAADKNAYIKLALVPLLDTPFELMSLLIGYWNETF